jgi:hypothetical protein
MLFSHKDCPQLLIFINVKICILFKTITLKRGSGDNHCLFNVSVSSGGRIGLVGWY